ncbi:hypothetical protein SAMN06297229_2159 [Pseudidiomarina planktonica]|uniref:RcsF protein n=1 Tax=Pseudidiomarina planktonica TaxID=1323738 RepID=A0A1Y6FXL3_9GAMM|nr:hypothetical protein [Pseudidiomarina planktonica]RUO63375.1 hypothetical protein CWI77_11035 [Pseudidiomarina planktonica]SMQ80397.1 hypothetical protein SAMN06297229_2159 [Pseudidiomarina planktonica]
MLLLLAGCQNIPFLSDTEPKRASLDEVLLEQVQFYRPYEIYNADFEAQLLGSARGIDCQQGWNDDAPEQRSALLALKADVLNAGGNAVVLTHCQTVELNQCNAAIQCDGTGYVVDEEQRKQQQSSNSPLDKPDIWF